MSTHILVVEDDPASGRVLTAKLGAAGHRVTVAHNAAEAERLARETAPDLIVSDIGLPGIDGIELTKRLRATDQTAHVPILLVTAMDDSKTLSRGLEAGADDFLTKPVNSLELRTRVRSLLRTKSLTDELRARGQPTTPYTAPTEGKGPLPEGADAPVRSTASAPLAATILLVEDNEQERALLETFLADFDCQIVPASDGREAMAALEEHRPDLVVLDLLLPDISGYELISQIKRKPSLAQTPILVVSVVSDVQDRVKALELGADDFIVKGFDRVEFKARVARLIRLKHTLEQLNDRCDQAVRQAMIDSLTGLLTHGCLKEMLQRELSCTRRHAQSVSVIFCDIDRFKQINDHHGHTQGDKVLKTVAQTIRKIIRTCDIVGRYGGDEFVVVLPQTDASEAMAAAERIRTVIQAEGIFLPGAGERDALRLTVSLGVASSSHDATDAEDLLQHADEALYAAKGGGRNQVASFGSNHASRGSGARMLIVDDEERNIRLLETLLTSEGYETIKACDGIEALETARRLQPDLILLDAMMPRLHGFDVCRRLKQEPGTRLIPVVLVTALGSREDKLRGVEAGADDFLTKPVDKTELLTRVRALLRSKRSTDLLEDAETVIFTLARAVESRDPSTGGHVERVSHYAVELAKAIGLPDAQVEGLRRAGVVHDIGKVNVPDAVLLKPGKLTPEERNIMERHAEVGYELLRPLRTFAEALPAVRFHHERLDGSGYPLGLRGEEVPKIAQIMAIVDVYDALTTDRCYRAALSRAEAVRILRDEASRGLHNPKLVETFIQLVSTN